MGSDFNGDGRDDVFWLYLPASTYTDWLGATNGGFVENGTVLSQNVPPDWVVFGLGDFNGDGRDDILWRHSSGLITDWLGTVDGGFINNHVNSAAMMPGDWNVAGTGDFNGDGRADILWRHKDGTVTDWLGTVSGGFVMNSSSLMAFVPTDWQVAGTGDFNGDGRADILWRHDGGMVTDWLGTADGGFINNHSNSAVRVPADWKVVGTGDFNGDGRADVLWRHESGLVTNWLGTSNGSFLNNHLNSAALRDMDWQVVGTGDYNGDGRDDILWRRPDAITNWLSTENGGHMNNDAAAYHEWLDGNWIVQPNPTGAGSWDY